jgi:hypothetical protein
MFRIMPALPVTAMKTYAVLAPAATHFRAATCEEVGCAAYLSGWRVRVEGLPAEMVHAARTSGRRFVETRIAQGETWLVFEAGQRCFRSTTHRVRVARPEIYLVRGGDWRGNPSGQSLRRSPDDWVDDFANHQDKLAHRLEQG